MSIIDEARCSSCCHWLPMFYQVGRCKRECAANSKIWCDKDDARIFTDASFSCQAFERITNTERDTV